MAESERIVLANEPAFALGGVQVVPALRQVESAAGSRTVEPRVMQVLVALHRAAGGIVGRDALITRCWDGRVVGEGAINRAISLLRQIGAETGAFEIETVTKVGYRLRPTGKPPEAVETTPTVSRRGWIGGAAAAAVATGVGIYAWRDRYGQRAEADRLLRAGLDVQRRENGGLRQAIALLEQAVAADPGHAAAWAALAQALHERSAGLPDADQPRTVAAARHAALRALGIAPRNAAATVTLAMLDQPFRRWQAAETATKRALQTVPGAPELHARLGAVFADTGQWRQAAVHFGEAARREPLTARFATYHASALAESGNVTAAGRIMDRLAQPAGFEPDVWLARFLFESFHRSPAAALRLAGGNAIGLGGANPLPREVGVLGAEALRDRTPAAVAAAVGAIETARSNGLIASFLAIRYLAALGAVDNAFVHAGNYLLGRADSSGHRAAPPPGALRRTDILFTGSTRVMRSDPRFRDLTTRLGLDAYWRATGTAPDPPPA